MELELRRGEVFSVEIPKETIAELSDVPAEDFTPVLSFEFISNGLFGLLDLNVYLSFATGSKKYEIDSYGTSESVDKVAKIQELLKEVLETAENRKLWLLAKQELLQEMSEN